MRYIFLIYNSEAGRATAAPEDLQRCTREHCAVMDEVTKRGILQGVAPLQPTSTAVSVRHRNGKPLITDGPFAETKEQLGGYYVLDCRDLDEALEWAAKIPTVGDTGCIEVRALMDLPAR
jgi:hypothetical protein